MQMPNATPYPSPPVPLPHTARRHSGSRGEGRKPPSIWWMIIVLIILVAAGVRFYDLGAQSLWSDEGNSYVQSTRTLPAIIENAANDIHPPGYYMLLAGWRLLAGESEFALRALSAFAGVITVAASFAVGQRVYGAGGGLIAAGIVALNSFAVYYSQEARMYALLAMWGALGMLTLTHLIPRPTIRRLIFLAIINAAGLYTHYGYGLVILAQGVVALALVLRPDRRRSFVAFIGASALTAILYLPWAFVLFEQLQTWREAQAAYTFNDAVSTTINTLIYGVTLGELGAAIPLMLMAFALILTPPRRLWQHLFAPAWVIIPVAVFIGLGLYRPDDVKLLIPAQVGAAVWIGGGVVTLWRLGQRPRVGFAARAAAVLSAVWVIGTLAVSVPPLYSDPAYQPSNYRMIARTLAAELDTDDAIILNAPGQAEVFNYYYDGAAEVYGLPQTLNVDDAATAVDVQTVIDQHEQIAVVFWGEDERDPNRIVETTLDEAAYELTDRWYGDLRLARYATPAEMTSTQALNTQFGDHITLQRAAWNAEAFARGEALQLQLTWTTDTRLEMRYKVFVQLLDANGVLAAQRDSEPGGGLALTTTWMPDEPVIDNHAVLLDLPAGDYQIIVGMYDLNDPSARLMVGDESYLTIGTITVR